MDEKIFLKFKKDAQRNLIIGAIKKAGSRVDLIRFLKIPSSSLDEYKNEIRCLPLKRLKKLSDFLNLEYAEIKKDIEKEFSRGWNQRDINFLKENYHELTSKEIAVKLNKTRDSVKHKCRALGLEKGRDYRWKKEKVILSFKKYIKEIGKTPSYQECAKYDGGLISAIHRIWGKYSEFLDYLGLSPKIKFWTEEKCMIEFDILRKEIKKIPTQKDLSRCLGLHKAILKRWRTYNNFLKKLGHNPNFELKWSRDKCLLEFENQKIKINHLPTIRELLKENPSLVAAIYKYFNNYSIFVKLAGYKYDDKWQKWERLVEKICKRLYTEVLIKPKLKNNKQPDIAIMKGEKIEKIIDAKINSFAQSINLGISKYKPHCNELEFWCLMGERKLKGPMAKIVGIKQIKQLLKQGNHIDLIKEIEEMEK